MRYNLGQKIQLTREGVLFIRYISSDYTKVQSVINTSTQFKIIKTDKAGSSVYISEYITFTGKNDFLYDWFYLVNSENAPFAFWISESFISQPVIKAKRKLLL